MHIIVVFNDVVHIFVKSFDHVSVSQIGPPLQFLEVIFRVAQFFGDLPDLEVKGSLLLISLSLVELVDSIHVRIVVELLDCLVFVLIFLVVDGLYKLVENLLLEVIG